MAAIASRYARALADSLLDSKSQLTGPDAVEQLRSFEAMLESSPDLRNVLLSPAVPPARKRSVVRELGDRIGLASLIRNFIYVVIDHRRTRYIPEIREVLERYLDESLGVVRAEVSSALELTPQQRETVTEKLSGMTGKRVKSKFVVDEDLVGGITARIGSTIYDGSVRGQLQAMRRKLMSEA